MTIAFHSRTAMAAALFALAGAASAQTVLKLGYATSKELRAHRTARCSRH